jgi:hypothetical protein
MMEDVSACLAKDSGNYEKAGFSRESCGFD